MRKKDDPSVTTDPRRESEQTTGDAVNQTQESHVMRLGSVVFTCGSRSMNLLFIPIDVPVSEKTNRR